MGPVSFAEHAGTIRSADSGEESGLFRDSGESASARENAGQSDACSNVANGPTAAELVGLINAAIIALDACDSEIARAHLQVLAEAAPNPRSRLRARWSLNSRNNPTPVPAYPAWHSKS